ncbi:MAG: TIGR01459 family HAD-type hydrolase [Pseudomonadota bacterium]
MTCRIITSLAEVADAYDAVFCDLWGCYHNGIEPFSAAVAACQTFRAKGGKVVLLTNAPRPAPAVKSFLDRIGAPEDSYDAIVSSGAACQAALAGGKFGDKFFYVGQDRDLHMLSDLGLAPVPLGEASAILITGLRDDRVEGPEDYADEIRDWVERGLTMLCANPDLQVDRGHERLWCAGAIARDYAAAGGEVIWYGKPHLPVYDRCHEVLAELTGAETPKERVLAIGDGILTDVPGGIAAGLDTLFVTGGLAAQDLGPDPEHPQQDLLDGFLTESGLTPAYAIGRLR